MKQGFLRKLMSKLILSLPLIALSMLFSVAAVYADTITIVESTPIRHENQTFEFTGGLGSFSLDDNGSNADALSNTVTFSPAAGTYSVTQSEVINWSLLSLACVGDTDSGTVISLATRNAVIDMDVGEDITCTFTNDMTSSNVSEDPVNATIIVTVDSIPDNEHDFFFLSDFGSFTIDDDGNVSNDRSNTITLQKPVGYYNLTEDQDDGQVLTGISCVDPDNGTTIDILNSKVLLDLDKGETILCTFVNSPEDYLNNLTQEEDDGTTGDDNNGNDNNNGNNNNDDDDDDQTPPPDEDDGTGGDEYNGLSCGDGLYLTVWIHRGWENDPAQVTKLQTFLNENLGLSLEVNGVYDQATFEAVNTFQVGNFDEVLAPWGIDKPTGFVYLTTQRWVNITACPGTEIPMPELVPYNQR
ncbi:MAG: peptidoglycan-binding domain-containing protein [Candidatus Gracilibacteria bacterium]